MLPSASEVSSPVPWPGGQAGEAILHTASQTSPA